MAEITLWFLMLIGPDSDIVFFPREFRSETSCERARTQVEIGKRADNRRGTVAFCMSATVVKKGTD